MARKQSGVLSRFLDMIGLVDDSESEDVRVAASVSKSNYSRSTYVPQSQRGDSAPRSRAAIPQQGGKSRYAPRTASRSYGETGSETEYRPTRLHSEQREQQEPRVSSRRPSRFEEPPAPQAEPAPRMSRARASTKTFMTSVSSIKECCDVIDHLVTGNTIILTITHCDETLRQRIIDTLSGATFALRATIKKASSTTYLIAPEGVTVNDTFGED